jgi:hypothetical protein
MSNTDYSMSAIEVEILLSFIVPHLAALAVVDSYIK